MPSVKANISSPSPLQQVPFRVTNLLDFHPLANVFPLMEGPQFDELVADIRAHGVREPVVLYEDKVLDGRSRARAANVAGVPCPTQPYQGDDAVAFVFSQNLHRYHWNQSQRAMVAASLATMRQGRRTDISSKDERSQAQAAALLNVSPKSVERGVAVRNHGDPDLIRAAEEGRIKVSPASRYARLPEAEQRKIVAELPDAVVFYSNKHRKKRLAELKRHENALIAAQPITLPTGKFETIVVDPPWPVGQRGEPYNFKVGWDYPTMTVDQIIEFGSVIRERAADDAHCFLWTTQKYLPHAFRVMEAWGFRYVFTMVWAKNSGLQPLKLPKYNSEFILYGRRGLPKFIDTKKFATCFWAKRRDTSRKPDAFYDTIRRVTRGPCIDMFSREKREGFAQHGLADEINKFSEAAE